MGSDEGKDKKYGKGKKEKLKHKRSKKRENGETKER